MADKWKIKRLNIFKNQENNKSEKSESEEKTSKPRGWHLRAEFIDSDGKVYHYGKLVE